MPRLTNEQKEEILLEFKTRQRLVALSALVNTRSMDPNWEGTIRVSNHNSGCICVHTPFFALFAGASKSVRELLDSHFQSHKELINKMSGEKDYVLDTKTVDRHDFDWLYYHMQQRGIEPGFGTWKIILRVPAIVELAMFAAGVHNQDEALKAVICQLKTEAQKNHGMATSRGNLNRYGQFDFDRLEVQGAFVV